MPVDGAPGAVDDPAGDLVLRVVFDGAPLAGKTTALYSLSEALGEVAVTPAEDDQGRTAWFDWMSYTAGRHEGRAIRTEAFTVPGRAAFDDRRRQLLARGDVVIFVVDCRPTAFGASVAKFEELRDDLRRLGDRPVVVLANTRSEGDAVDLDECRTRLGLDSSALVVEGVATTGVGLRRAFICAVRAALAVRSGAAPTVVTRAPVRIPGVGVPVDAEAHAPGERSASSSSGPSSVDRVALRLDPYAVAVDGTVAITASQWDLIVDIAGGRRRLGSDASCAAIEAAASLRARGLLIGADGDDTSEAAAEDVAAAGSSARPADAESVDESVPLVAPVADAAVSGPQASGRDAVTEQTLAPAARAPQAADTASSATADRTVPTMAGVRTFASQASTFVDESVGEKNERYRALRELRNLLRSS